MRPLSAGEFLRVFYPPRHTAEYFTLFADDRPADGIRESVDKIAKPIAAYAINPKTARTGHVLTVSKPYKLNISSRTTSRSQGQRARNSPAGTERRGT